MTRREKLLLAAVALLGLTFAGIWVVQQIGAAIESREDQVLQLQEQIRKKEFTNARGKRAAEQLAAYENQALPENRELARSMYQRWLLEVVEEASLEDVKVDPVGGRAVGDVYFVHPFSVSARGNLEQLVQFLYTFYRADFLHRIERLAVTPIKDSKQLDLTMTVEAVGLPGSTNVEGLPERKSNRLALESLTDYTQPILRRNLFGPPNSSPRLEAVGTRQTEVNKPFSLRLRARDPDEQDQLTYWLQADERLGATIDSASGELTFTPQEVGEYEFTVGVQDNGLPEGSDKTTVRVTVVDPPPPPEPTEPEPPKPSFDEAQFAFVTGIIEVDGVPEAWISLRTKGELLKVREGDAIQVGQFTGRIKRIHPKVVEFESDQGQLFVKRGQNLGQAEALRADDI